MDEVCSHFFNEGNASFRTEQCSQMAASNCHSACCIIMDSLFCVSRDELPDVGDPAIHQNLLRCGMAARVSEYTIIRVPHIAAAYGHAAKKISVQRKRLFFIAFGTIVKL